MASILDYAGSTLVLSQTKRNGVADSVNVLPASHKIEGKL